jgi:poly(3-hydroxybutyrate) depolymerase
MLLSALVMLFACSNENTEVIEPVSFLVDPSRVTVSGLSSGGYMAGQLHLAHSSLFSGAAILAGGPYWCAQASLSKGLGPCLKGGDVEQQKLLDYAHAMATAGKVDALANLTDDAIWIFHGAHDVAVNADVSIAAAAFYTELISKDAVTVVTDAPVVHGMPTISLGTPCDTMATPYLNACNYDAAGKLLNALYGSLHARVSASGEIRNIPQPGGDDAEMLEFAFLYVPESCAAGASCGLHVALHGCQQSAEFVGDTFAAGAGYNEWAEANNLLVLYPQAASSKLAPMNPLGCWDWWGYTNENYATKDGPQVAVIKAMIDVLAATEL